VASAHGISSAKRHEGPFSRQFKMDLMIGYLLLIGVGLSLAQIAVGLCWNLLRTGHFWLDYQLGGTNLFEFALAEVRSTARGQVGPRTLVDGGIATLMFTPYLRVLASMLYFMFALKNWKYSLFTAIVLGVLTFSLFLR
jgi:uncharacterized membrane protein